MRRPIPVRRAAGYLAAAVAAFPAVVVYSAPVTRTWVGGSSDWDTAANWSPAGIPAAGDSANFIDTDGLSRTLNYDYTLGPVTLNSFTVDLSGSSIAAGNTLAMGANVLTSTAETVGMNGVGVFNQPGGVNTINSTSGLTLGANGFSSGTYILSSTASLVSSGSETIGGLGAGTFNQTGTSGNFIINGQSLILGEFSKSIGAYSLSGASTLSVNGGELIGSGGSATFSQTGGVNMVTGSFVVANLGTSTATYAQSAGATTVSGAAYIGGASTGAGGVGTLAVSGGTLSITGALTVYSTPGSSFALNGTAASVTANSLNLSGNVGLLRWTAGALTLTGNNPLQIDNTASANFASNLTLSNSQVLTTGGDELIGFNGTGSVTLTGAANSNANGGSDSLSSPTSRFILGFNAGATGSLTIGNEGSLSASGNEYVGFNGAGTLNQSSGVNIFGSNLFVATNTPSTGSYNFSGGFLTGGALTVGNSAAGAFNQSGGTSQINSVTLGAAGGGNGTYLLSGGELSVAGNELVGAVGPGTFVQSGGTQFLNELSIGDGGGASGQFTLTSGVINVSSEIVGNFGTGSLVQSGGSHVIVGNLQIAPNLHSSGTASFSGGNLIASDIIVGSAASQGTLNFTGNAQASVNSIQVLSGAINVSGGAVTFATGLDLNGSPSAFNWSGGTLNFPSATIDIEQDQSAPTLNNLGPSLTIGPAQTLLAQAETIGPSSVGVVTQSSGSNTVTTDLSLGASGGAGEYTLSGGVVNAQTLSIIAGTFAQSGGSTLITGQAPGVVPFNFSPPAGVSAVYTLSGGVATINGGGQVGSDSAGVSALNISGGTMNVTGTLSVAASSTVTLSGGALAAPAFAFESPSSLNWTGGTLSVGADLALDPLSGQSTSALFGSGLTLGAGQTLQVTGDETIGGNAPFSLTLNGGAAHSVSGDITLNANGALTQNFGSTLFYNGFTQNGGAINGVFQNQGQFIYKSGSFNARLINQSAVSLESSFTAANGIENDSFIELSAGQTITANGLGFDNLGLLTLDGGVLAGNGPFTNDFSGTASVSASMVIASAFTNDGLFSVDSALTLTGGAATNFGVLALNSSGFIRQGSVNNSGMIVLAGGALTGGATNNSGGIIQGSGAVSGGLTNNAGGIVQANGTSGPLTISTFTANNAGATVEIAAGTSLNVLTAWTNSGLLDLQGPGAVLGGATLLNSGTIQGAGEISPSLNNVGTIASSAGELDLAGQSITNSAGGLLQVNAGSTLAFIQGLSTNSGTITLSGGTFNNEDHALTNTTTGLIFGSGQLESTSLNNSGTLYLLGTSTVTGNVVSSGGILLSGSGANIFTGSVTNTGTLTVDPGASGSFFGPYSGSGSILNNGTLFIHTSSVAGPISGNGSLTLGQVAGPTTLTLLSLDDISTQSLLTISTGSTLDLTNNALTLNYGAAGNDPATAIVALLRSGYNHGNWLGAGITSSTAAAAPTKFALGYSDGNVDSASRAAHNQFLIEYTLAGDANLDGSVGFFDLVAVAENFGATGKDWSQGNFTYDPNGSIGFADLVLVAENFGQSGVVAADLGAARELSPVWSDAESTAFVPEPIGLLTISAAGFMLIRRRPSKR